MAIFDQLKRSIDRGIVNAGVQSTTYLETGKLRSKIDHINDSIQQIKVELGQTVYANWKNGVDNTSYIKEVCNNIQKMEQEIASYEVEIAQLQEEKNRVLYNAAAPTGEAEGVLCSCGQRNSADAKFCTGCGKPVEAAPQESAARFCEKCGASLAENAQFCSNCGAPQGNV